MKTLDCPMCGEQPITIKTAGVWMTCCLPCTNTIGPHAEACATISESKRTWNEFATAFADEKNRKRKASAK